MPYSRRIKALEESYNLVESQIKALESVESPDRAKIIKLYEAKNKYLSELKVMRRAQYEAHQEVDFGDDR